MALCVFPASPNFEHLKHYSQLIESGVFQPSQWRRDSSVEGLSFAPGGLPMHLGMFSNIPDLYPLDASSTPSPIFDDRSRHCNVP